MEMLRVGMYGKKGVVESFITHRIEMLIIYIHCCIYFLYRNNCFGLSAKDSRDC